jgi:hypothetical protein
MAFGKIKWQKNQNRTICLLNSNYREIIYVTARYHLSLSRKNNPDRCQGHQD